MIKKLLLLSFLTISLSLSSQDHKRIDSLLHFAGTTKVDTSKAKALCYLCWEYRTTDSAKSRSFGTQGLELASRIGFEPAQAQCLSNIAAMYFKNLNYDSALTLHKKALIIRQKVGDQNKTAYCIRDIGECYTQLGKYDQAIKYYFEALKIFESKNNKKAIYNTCCAIAEVYYLDNNIAQSIKQVENALAIPGR